MCPSKLRHPVDCGTRCLPFSRACVHVAKYSPACVACSMRSAAHECSMVGPTQPGAGMQQKGEEDDKAEVDAIKEEEDITVLSDADRERQSNLDSLTGCPRQGDVLLYALPMAAPYSALQGYKLRVKITPGTQRKGKAARQVLSWLCASRCADHQNDMRVYVRISSPAHEKVCNLPMMQAA